MKRSKRSATGENENDFGQLVCYIVVQSGTLTHAFSLSSKLSTAKFSLPRLKSSCCFDCLMARPLNFWVLNPIFQNSSGCKLKNDYQKSSKIYCYKKLAHLFYNISWPINLSSLTPHFFCLPLLFLNHLIIVDLKSQKNLHF